MIDSTSDAYFLDRNEALRIARARQRVRLDDGSEVVQTCYYDGDPLPNTADNLVHVPLADLFRHFAAHPELRLPTQLCYAREALAADAAAALERHFAEILDAVRAARVRTRTPVDSYFLDAEQARAAAREQNRVQLEHPTIDGLQICYYDGEPGPNAPANCIPVPADQLIDFLTTTRLRPPQRIVLPPHAAPADVQAATRMFGQILEAATDARERATATLCEHAYAHRPLWMAGRPLRFWLPTTRLTTVMQYASRNLAKSLRALGHEVHVSCEANDMERVSPYHFARDYLCFGPDAVIAVNAGRPAYMHPDVIHIGWWQDPMPQITGGTPLPWQARDLVYSISHELDKHLDNCAAPTVQRQHFCIDTELFAVDPSTRRDDKIVFVGSSYAGFLDGSDAERGALAELREWLEAGRSFDTEQLRALAVRHGLTFDHVFWNLFHYTVRDITLEWLCRVSPIPVEVYGRGWQTNRTVVPFFKGELAHGRSVAAVYNRARYGLVTHPFEINSQRLAEVAACGAIPVVFDCRNQRNAPHWERHCNFFKRCDDLRDAVQRRPEAAPTAIVASYSYAAFARRIVNDVERLLSGDQHAVSGGL